MSSLNTSGLTAFCPQCCTCLEGSVTQCPECQEGRPGKGWPSIYDSPYVYLGRMVEGRYLIDRFLDSGASGHVYRARSLRFARHFAVKVVDTSRYGNEKSRLDMTERFHREVDTLSRIRNPHVVGVYEVVELGEGVFGLVLDFIDGQTLDALLAEQGRLSLDDAVSIVLQIANGVHEAHRNGIIHRDLKPQNIMVESLPASGLFARVLDFGIAHTVGSSQETHSFQGTPLYASPEQCTGGSGLDHRSDIYSLGCLFFHLLTGRPPFPYTNALRVMDAHVDAPRPRLTLALADVDFPRELENLIDHLLARHRADRPDDLHLVHQDLAAFQRGKPMTHFGQPPPYRAVGVAESSSDWSIPPAPSSEEFVSLSERTSTELASDPTFSEVADDLPKWETHSSVDLELLFERRIPSLDARTLTITAAVIDRRGMVCVIADHTPRVCFMELGSRGYQSFFDRDCIVSALDVDLDQGLLYVADVRGNLFDLDPGSGMIRGSRILTGSPLALDVASASRKLYYGTERGEIHVLDLRTNSQRQILTLPHAVSTIHTSKDGPLLAGLWDGSVAQITPEGRVKWHLPIAPDSIASTGYLDEQTYFAIDSQGTIHLGERDQGTRRNSYGIGRGLRALRLLNDGRLVALSLFGELVQVWKILLKQ